MTTDATSTRSLDQKFLRQLANTVRGLAIDGIEKANSGHPGLPMGCADFATLLFLHHLNFDPAHPEWPNRDRFVLSGGHGSMLLYALLHLCGYEDLPMEELRNFRQLDSKTPGHPENFLVKGIETTTGPLGQGFANGVGMALAAEMMAARFPDLLDHRIYGIVTDGDLMEGVSAEAASFAGHHRLGRIVYFYDDNHITIEGNTDLTFSAEDVGRRFEAYGWHVQRVDGHDFEQMHGALTAAEAVADRPSIIVGRTHIGFGSPNRVDTPGVHGSPLGAKELKLAKENLGLPADKDFYVPDADYQVWGKRAAEGAGTRAAWQAKLDALDAGQRAAMDAMFAQKTPDLKALRPAFDAGKAMATRKSAGAALNAYAAAVPWLVGGSADLAPSTNTLIKGSDSIGPNAFAGRNLHFGIREHAMGSIMNGMSLYGTFKPYGATFLVFSDYMRPAVRLAALMHLPAIFIFTHDSIFLGEDGPTHQPVEHLAALRAIPRLTVIRPGDAEEAAVAWEVAIAEKDGPIALALTRQDIPNLDRGAGKLAAADGLARGAYVIRAESGAALELILIATGSELHLALNAAETLEAEGRGVRVVSMPSQELFRRQPASYREEVLPRAVRKRLVIEAGIRQGWDEFATDEGDYIVIGDRFGASAPDTVLAEYFGFTVEGVADKARKLLG